MDVLELIGEIEDIIDSAKPALFTNKVTVEKEKVLKLLEDLRLKLPEEIQKAGWIKRDREIILNEARMDGDKLINDAKVQLARLLSQESVTVEARRQATEMMESAKQQSANITIGSIDYTDKLLVTTQEQLKNVIETLNDNRRQLQEMRSSVQRG